MVHKFIVLNRTDIKKGLQTILEGIDLIKKGTSIVIFPEGTRSKTEDLLPFKEGSLKIAEKSKCPIIPVAITNTESVFENHLPRIKKASVVIEFGTPIYLDHMIRRQNVIWPIMCVTLSLRCANLIRR